MRLKCGGVGRQFHTPLPKIQENISTSNNHTVSGMDTKSVQAQSPATPVYILRGHASPIHALNIYSQNLRLVSGDANGWIVVWDLVTKRPVTGWKAHEGAILEARGFNVDLGATEIYTYDDSSTTT